ncbi:MAG: protein-L-isoaspartate(D-aspartate) O-methyltransferase [FCB group bacterium]|nr:protein-L-isoaspartate(D-aspartate) O-methyltransferase [FCB group bacterium]
MLFKRKPLSGKNYTLLRQKMVKNQLYDRGIRDENVLSAMKQVPRHLFVPNKLKHYAYDDGPLSIGYDQTISQPFVVASMTENLELKQNSRVLEIGTGSGYQTAILAAIAKEVYTVEIIPELLQKAQKLFQKLHYSNIRTKLGDGSIGWKEYAPYDAIIVTAAAPKIPKELINQLAEKGTMILPLIAGLYYDQILTKVKKSKQGLTSEELYGVRFVPMQGKVED